MLGVAKGGADSWLLSGDAENARNEWIMVLLA
jgi:hypothetical protein